LHGLANTAPDFRGAFGITGYSILEQDYKVVKYKLNLSKLLLLLLAFGMFWIIINTWGYGLIHVNPGKDCKVIECKLN